LDRLDEATATGGSDAIAADARMQQIYESLDLLTQRKTTPDRAERLLNLFSDVD
jgi:hypothetical protein